MKKALGSLSLAFGVIALAVHLPGSVAELRGAARVSAALQASSRAAAVYGPRRPSSASQTAARRPLPVTIDIQREINAFVATAPTAPVILPVEPQRRAEPVTPHLEEKLRESGANPHHRDIARRVLGMLDPACQEKLETLNILYGKPKHRGLAGRGVILVSGMVPDDEFIGLLLHEGFGHFRDITCLTGNPESGPSEFRDGGDEIWNDDASVFFYRLSWSNDRERKEDARREDFVTGYAYDADNFEDLAESVTYYMTQEQSFRERAAANPILAQKLAWLETYVPKQRNVAEGREWNGLIPWDATKLAFRWNP